MIDNIGYYLRLIELPLWETKQHLPMNELIGVKGVAKEWGVSPRDVQVWQDKGWMLPRRQRGKMFFYRRADIQLLKAFFKMLERYYRS